MGTLALYSTGKPRDQLLAEALRAAGHQVTVLPVDAEIGDYDLHCVISVSSPELWRRLGAAGVKRLLWDKGYNRDFPRWWRVAFDGHQPADYVGRANHPADRAEAQGWIDRIEDLRTSADKGVLLAGASPNYQAFAGLPDPTTYAEQIIAAVRELTDRPIVYRPKPQWREAVAVEGAEFSHHPVKVKGHRIRVDLERAHVMIVHASNACLEAALAGVPVICLGPAVTRSISSTDLLDVENPRRATREERLQAVANIAYCQWSLDEIASGEVWPYIQEQMHGRFY